MVVTKRRVRWSDELSLTLFFCLNSNSCGLEPSDKHFYLFYHHFMTLVSRTSQYFPKRFLACKTCPLSLSISGIKWVDKISRLSGERVLTVVGSRKMTRYGEQVVSKLLIPLVQAGVVIVSGFMYGVDQSCHRVCLDYGGLTVAVLGWGIDWPVLPVEQPLYQEIKAKGLLLSEYPKKTSPQLWMFPARDRLMAALGQATLVIEAAEKSGSLITARYAKQFKRPLFSVPGPITSTVSSGTNMLIKSGQALAVTSANDIFAVMGWPSQNLAIRDCERQSENANRLENILSREPMTIDELAQAVKKTVSQVSAQLSIMQLQGVVKETNGKYYLTVDVNQD